MRRAAATLAAIALCSGANAQPYGYRPDPWSAAYAYVYAPPIAYGPDGRDTPYAYPNGYDGYHLAPALPESAQRLSGTQEHGVAAGPTRGPPPRQGRAAQCTLARAMTSPSPDEPTSITCPSSSSPASSLRAIGSTSSFWMTRFSGLAP